METLSRAFGRGKPRSDDEVNLKKLEKVRMGLLKSINGYQKKVKKNKGTMKDAKNERFLKQLEEREAELGLEIAKLRASIQKKMTVEKKEDSLRGRARTVSESKKGHTPLDLSIFNSPSETAQSGTSGNSSPETNSSPKMPPKKSAFRPRATSNTSELFFGSALASELSQSLLTMGPSEDSGSTQSLLLDHFVVADPNKRKQKRAKRSSISVSPDGKPKPIQMEDEHFVQCPLEGATSLAAFGVFDGHVDKNAAAEAKALFPSILTKEINGETSRTTLEDTLQSCFHQVDQEMQQFECEGCTATVLVTWRTDDQRRFVQAANVGDSSGFIKCDNDIIPITQDHKVELGEERRRIRALGCELNENQTRLNGLAVSRSLGDHFAKNLEVGLISEPYVSEAIELSPSSEYVAIIASDGLWDAFSAKKSFEIISTQSSAQEKATTLLRTALKSPKCQDNITVCIILF